MGYLSIITKVINVLIVLISIASFYMYTIIQKGEWNTGIKFKAMWDTLEDKSDYIHFIQNVKFFYMTDCSLLLDWREGYRKDGNRDGLVVDPHDIDEVKFNFCYQKIAPFKMDYYRCDDCENWIDKGPWTVRELREADSDGDKVSFFFGGGEVPDRNVSLLSDFVCNI